MENTKNCYANATKAINDSLLTYMKLCNIHVGANALSEGNYFESAKEVQEKEDNERKVEEEWSSYPSSIPNNGNFQVPMNTPSYTIARDDFLYSDEPIFMNLLM